VRESVLSGDRVWKLIARCYSFIFLSEIALYFICRRSASFLLDEHFIGDEAAAL
jgi:hypothetical protein